MRYTTLNEKVVTLRLIIALCVFCMAGSHAAAESTQLMSVRSLRDALVVDYRFSLTRPASDYATVVTPMLCGATDTLRLEPVTVRGARNAKKMHRDYSLNRHGAAEPEYIAAKDMPAEVKGSHTIQKTAANAWLFEKPFTLCVLTEREGCCKVETLAMGCTPAANYDYRPPFVPTVLAEPVPALVSVTDQMAAENSFLKHISEYQPYDSTRILRKEKDVLYVHFPVSKSVLLRDFRNNADILDRIIDVTRKVMADTTKIVEKIQVIGLASVEGPVAFNKQLAGDRAKMLQLYVQKTLGLEDKYFDCINGGEAWAELRDQITESNNPYREQLLYIIDNTPNLDLREKKIKALAGGKAFALLRDNELKDQRNSGYIHIYYNNAPDAAAAAINKASEMIRNKNYKEALRLLQTVSQDERAQNALGVALYMTGKTAEAKACFQRAAAGGDAQAKKNLEGLK